jgi:hypothetical protein
MHFRSTSITPIDINLDSKYIMVQAESTSALLPTISRLTLHEF